MLLAKKYFTDLIADNKSRNPKGIYSICSTNKCVIEAGFKKANELNNPILIESTCNQVNQFGGYTGMTPKIFRDYIFSLAQNMHFSTDRIILGGDHLGPYPFKNEDSEDAMAKAHKMIEEYIKAGFTKLHIDTSMPLGDDNIKGNIYLEKEIIAQRCSELIETSERILNSLKSKNSKDSKPVYVIGSDVPMPGGSTKLKKEVEITKVSDFEETVRVNEYYFYKKKMFDAWERVMAVVVQPGVDHGDDVIIDYDRNKTKGLTASLKKFQNLIFEAHSTDYQTEKNLKNMVEDGFAILKVGPSLTNAFKETVFMLYYIEEELCTAMSEIKKSKLIEILNEEMIKNSKYWENYYGKNENKLKNARLYSLYDRIRYYWGNDKVIESLDLLINNLRTLNIPLTLVSQFLPIQYNKVREGFINIDPMAFILEGIINVINKYSHAVGS